MQHSDTLTALNWFLNRHVKQGDINAATAKAKSLGAKVIVDVREVMGHGQMSVLSDPTGATIALWEAKKP